MRLASNRLQAFYAIARVGSFSKAAQALHLTQSALSHRIANLEEDLQTTLFVREVGGLRLTEAGLALLRHCQVYESLENELQSAFLPPETDSSITGVLRIGGTSTLTRSVIMPALSPLVTDNPKLKVETYVRELQDLPRLLASGAIDYMVSCAPVPKDDLESHSLGFERNVMVTSARGSPREHIYLDHDTDDQTTIEFLKSRGKPTERIERSFVDDIDGILRGVELGWGSAIVPRHLLKGKKGIKVVKANGIWKKPVVLQHFRQPYYSRLHAAVIEALISRAPALLE